MTAPLKFTRPRVHRKKIRGTEFARSNTEWEWRATKPLPWQTRSKRRAANKRARASRRRNR